MFLDIRVSCLDKFYGVIICFPILIIFIIYSDNNHGDELLDLRDETVATKINPRENRTRLCFVIFASIALICVPLILVFSYSPMKEATDGSDELILVRITLL